MLAQLLLRRESLSRRGGFLISALTVPSFRLTGSQSIIPSRWPNGLLCVIITNETPMEFEYKYCFKLPISQYAFRYHVFNTKIYCCYNYRNVFYVIGIVIKEPNDDVIISRKEHSPINRQSCVISNSTVVCHNTVDTINLILGNRTVSEDISGYYSNDLTLHGLYPRRPVPDDGQDSVQMYVVQSISLTRSNRWEINTSMIDSIKNIIPKLK